MDSCLLMMEWVGSSDGIKYRTKEVGLVELENVISIITTHSRYHTHTDLDKEQKEAIVVCK